MSVPLLPLYVGFMAILSIFLYKNASEEIYMLETAGEWLKTIGGKLESHVADALAESNIMDHLKELKELKDKVGPLEDKTLANIAKLKEYFAHVENNWVYIRTKDLLSHVCEVSCNFLTQHPVVTTTLSQINGYINRFYNEVGSKLYYILGQEPIKGFVSRFCHLHSQYVTPHVDRASELVSKYINQALDLVNSESQKSQNNHLVYTFLIFSVGVLFFRTIITNFLRWFAKDAFQMNKSMEDMYKQQTQNAVIDQQQHHDAVYVTVKGGVSTESSMTVDELKELETMYELQEGSNRRTPEQPSTDGPAAAATESFSAAATAPATPDSQKTQPRHQRQEEEAELKSTCSESSRSTGLLFLSSNKPVQEVDSDDTMASSTATASSARPVAVSTAASGESFKYVSPSV